MKNTLLLFYSLIFTSCWVNSHSPAININYDFKNVGKLIIEEIEDFSNSPRSGEMVFANLTHNFLKFGYDVNKSIVTIGKNKKELKLSCVITEFTDSKMVVVPYRHEDRGYTKTIVKQSSKKDDGSGKLAQDQSQTSTVTTHAGGIKEGNKVEYSQCRVGVLLKLTDINTGTLVWSNSYWYSGLEMQRTIEFCLKNLVYQLAKMFK
mgnify:CR=1 FL=1